MTYERVTIVVSEHEDPDRPTERYRAEWPDDNRFFAAGETRKEAITSFFATTPQREIRDRCETMSNQLEEWICPNCGTNDSLDVDEGLTPICPTCLGSMERDADA